jgi:hypothetical protein
MLTCFTFRGSNLNRVTRVIDGGWNNPWAHCFTVVGQLAQEALPAGVKRRTISAALDGVQQFQFMSLSEDMGPAGPLNAANVAAESVGMEYDNLAIPALLIRRIFGTGPHWERPNKRFCAEDLLFQAMCVNSKVFRAVNNWPGRFGVADAYRILVEAGARPVTRPLP